MLKVVILSLHGLTVKESATETKPASMYNVAISTPFYTSYNQ